LFFHAKPDKSVAFGALQILTGVIIDFESVIAPLIDPAGDVD
jgi:hypothetical protein